LSPGERPSSSGKRDPARILFAQVVIARRLIEIGNRYDEAICGSHDKKVLSPSSTLTKRIFAQFEALAKAEGVSIASE